MKKRIKKIVKKIPIAFTQNQRYDRQTNKIIHRVCNPDSNCIDVGAHKGEVLDVILKNAPQGQHYAFEPIPALYQDLVVKYDGNNHVHVYDMALSNMKGESSFNYVVSNPSYSGLIKRQYDRPNEQDTMITVKTDRMDEVIPKDVKIDLIKIDVEGGELLVMEGAKELLKRDKPVIIFEHGLGASDHYNSTPEKVFALLQECGLQVSQMIRWLKGRPALTQEEFSQVYYSKKDYYFIAYP